MHIRFGRVEGMSTRKGEVVFLKDILDEAQDRVLQTMNQKDSKWTLRKHAHAINRDFLSFKN